MTAAMVQPGKGCCGHAGCCGMFWPEEERDGGGVGGHIVLGRLSNSRKRGRELDCMLMGMVEPALITGWWSESRPRAKRSLASSPLQKEPTTSLEMELCQAKDLGLRLTGNENKDTALG